MQLHQINVAYDNVHDRLLLRFSTTEPAEHRLWVTRRLLKGLWPGLVQLMHNTPMARQQAEPEARKAVVEFQREQALAQTKFGKVYEGAEHPPAQPGDPILVFGLRMRPNPDGSHDIEFAPKQGPGLHIRLQSAMVHALAKLLQDAVKTTDWDLKLEVPNSGAAMPPTAEVERKLN